jgi:hypothetical protein
MAVNIRRKLTLCLFICVFVIVARAFNFIRSDMFTSPQTLEEKRNGTALITKHGNDNNMKLQQPGSSSSNTTQLAVAANPKVFIRGYPFGSLAKELFPEFEQSGEWKSHVASNEKDLLVHGGLRNEEERNHIQEQFAGKVLFLITEWFGSIHTDDASSTNIDRFYQIGPVASDYPHSIRVFFLAFHFLNSPHTRDKRDWIFDPTQRQQNNGKHHAIAYITSNCVPFRQEAALALSKIVPVHYNNRCKVHSENAVTAPNSGHKNTYMRNFDLFRNYKYCLVMENNNKPGYVTEKILNAFLGGCLPIYYGTPEIFDTFHPQSFVYYDIENPQPVLDQIRYLERNASAYKERLDHPILRHGSQTVEEYFSLSDNIGNGTLKRMIRTMMSLE